MIRRIALSLAVFGALCFGACASGARKAPATKSAASNTPASRGASSRAASSRAAAAGSADAADLGASKKKAGPTGPAIVVTWEALAREKYLVENSRFKRRGPQAPMKIMLISSSHPDAAAIASGRGGRRRDPTVSTAILSDRDMVQFVRGLERRGFFRYARPAGYDTALAGSDNARGRITVTRDGTSRTLLSMRGQGLNEATKQIPAIYSEAKQAIMALRNLTPTLNVTRSSASGTVSVR